MKRETKFRGIEKNSSINRWVSGDLIHYKSGEMAILEIPFDRYGVEATQISRRTAVFPKSVGEYTGLKDKNGKEIYEGDIIKYKEWKNNSGDVAFTTMYIVEFRRLKWILLSASKSYSILLWQQVSAKVIQNLSNDGCKARRLEIIGNTYENPELLKQS